MFKMASHQLHGCRLCTSGAQRTRDQDKSITSFTSFYPGRLARGQNSVSGSYMHAIFELKAHEASEIWTSLPHTFTKEGLLQLPG